MPDHTSAGKTSVVRTRATSALELLLGTVLVLAVSHALFVLFVGLCKPLLDLHSFRQTQTALSVYWLIHGGGWFAYETPVLGAPWGIPFEFPLYQWIVALLTMIGVPLDIAGRLVSFAFYVATLWPLWILIRSAGLGRVAYLNIAILFMTAPLYLYWSRTFLMESCALFFCCLGLALLTVYLYRREPLIAIAATGATTAGTLAKATTFPGFAVVGGCLVLLDLGARLRDRREFRLWGIVVPGLILTMPLIVGYIWVIYSDHLKNANEFGRLLTSASLTAWNFGSVQQRLSLVLWDKVIDKRVLPNLFGPAVLVGFAALGAALPRQRFTTAASLAVIGFLVPFLVFTNLHIVHNYYQYANGIFALAAVGIGIASIAEDGLRAQCALAGTIIIIFVTSQIADFYQRFEPQIIQDTSKDPLFQAAIFLRKSTPADGSVLVFGNDWNSIVPYYSERKSLVVPNWAPPGLIDRVVGDPQKFLGNHPLAAIVLCRDRLAPYKDRAGEIDTFVSTLSSLGEFGDCQVFAAKR